MASMALILSIAQKISVFMVTAPHEDLILGIIPVNEYFQHAFLKLVADTGFDLTLKSDNNFNDNWL